MKSAVGTIFSADTGASLIVALVGAIFGFFAYYALDLIKRRREPRKRISYDIKIGATMATVPRELAEKVSVFFGGSKIDGQLYEVTARVSNSGNTVIKDQYLRFSFPDDSKILETYLPQDTLPEIGIHEAPLEKPVLGDRRWQIRHLEKGQSVEIGMLVVGRVASIPEVHGFNEAGDVTLGSKAAFERKDDADHIEPLLLFATLSIFLPPAISALDGFGGFLFGAVSSILRIALLALLIPHVMPVGRIIVKRIISRSTDTGEVRIQNESGQVFFATGSGNIRAALSAQDDDDPKSTLGENQ